VPSWWIVPEPISGGDASGYNTNWPYPVENNVSIKLIFDNQTNNLVYLWSYDWTGRIYYYNWVAGNSSQEVFAYITAPWAVSPNSTYPPNIQSVVVIEDPSTPANTRFTVPITQGSAGLEMSVDMSMYF